MPNARALDLNSLCCFKILISFSKYQWYHLHLKQTGGAILKTLVIAYNTFLEGYVFPHKHFNDQAVIPSFFPVAHFLGSHR